MPFLHELSTIIGNSSALGILSAVAAGLAALALLCGVAKVGRRELPPDFPADPEAQLDKYRAPFLQLEQAVKGNPEDVDELLEKLKSQPAAHLGLTAFQRFASSKRPVAKGKGAGVKTTQKGSQSSNLSAATKPELNDETDQKAAPSARPDRAKKTKAN